MVEDRRSRRVLARREKVYIGVDVHRRSWYVTALVRGAVLFRGAIPGNYKALRDVLDRFPDCEIWVAYEAGPFGFGLYDRLENDDIRCVVAAPSLIPVQSGNRVKTDPRDSRKLAELLATGHLTPVHVLSEEQRAHRELTRTRRQLVRHRGSVVRQVKSKLLFHSVQPPVALPRGLTEGSRTALRDMEFPFPALKTSICALLDTYEFVSERVKALTLEVVALSRAERYKDAVAVLLTVPGIGRVTAMEILTELGDMDRFPNNEALAAFLGLTPSEYSSGEQVRQGSITRCGNKRVRTALVESSWTLIRKDPVVRGKYDRIGRRRGAKRAITAVARNLAHRIRGLLLRNEAYAITKA